jgi:sec-independent protein translocase protein TatC
MDDRKQSIIDHLEELRMRILKSLACVVLFYAPGYALAQPSIELLKRYAAPPGVQFYYLEPMALFFTRMKLGLVYACLFALPLIAYQTWRFVTPGLYQRERFYIGRLSGVSTLLFLLGVAFSLGGIFPMLMRFSYGMSTPDIAPMLQVGSVVSLATLMSLGFGLMFQLPIVVFFCIISGLISLETMRKARPFIVVIIFVLAAVLTPPDVVSQICMGLPTWLLFEISLFAVARYTRSKARGKDEQDDKEEDISDEEDAVADVEGAAEDEGEAGHAAATSADYAAPAWLDQDSHDGGVSAQGAVEDASSSSINAPRPLRYLGSGRSGAARRRRR